MNTDEALCTLVYDAATSWLADHPTLARVGVLIVNTPNETIRATFDRGIDNIIGFVNHILIPFTQPTSITLSTPILTAPTVSELANPDRHPDAASGVLVDGALLSNGTADTMRIAVTFTLDGNPPRWTLDEPWTPKENSGHRDLIDHPSRINYPAILGPTLNAVVLDRLITHYSDLFLTLDRHPTPQP